MPVTRRCAAAGLALCPFAAAVAPLAAASEGGPDDPRWADDPRLAQLWRCTFPDCAGYVYDPLLGEPAFDVPPRTAFEDLPEDFRCPECGAERKLFMRYVNRAAQ